jgi:hypothetical protein
VAFVVATSAECSATVRARREDVSDDRAFIMVLPIATMLLNLRTAAEDEPEQSAETLVDADTLAVLRSSDRARLPTKPTARDVLFAIAALGGHFRHNGAPGWLVLMRGMESFLERLDAYRSGFRDAQRAAGQHRGQS